MKLAFKLFLSILLGIIAVLAVDTALTVRRETQTFRRDMIRNAHHFGRVMKAVAADLWARGGAPQIQAFLQTVNQEGGPLQVRVVFPDELPGSPFFPLVSPRQLSPVWQGAEIIVEAPDAGDEGLLISYLPLVIGGHIRGALEIAEPLKELHDNIRGAVVNSLRLLGMTVLSSGLVVLVVGVRMIGRPLDLLIEKTRRIGAGDFSGPLLLPGRDELARLGTAFNGMCDHLRSSRETARVETEARIDAMEQLRHSERLATVGRLAAGMAHELGTPLNVVSGRAKMIASGDLTLPEITTGARIIGEQAEKMTALMRQFLDFARRSPPSKRATELVPLVKSVVEMLAPQSRRHGVEISVHAPEGLPPVSVDPSQVQQVLTNLLMNALQAMDGDGRVEISLSTVCRGPAGEKEIPCIAVAVRDTGRGIPPEDLPKVFEPFFTTKGVGEGTGLGLSITYGIVQEHGGWIELQSETGRGSCFTVYFPLGGEK